MAVRVPNVRKFALAIIAAVSLLLWCGCEMVDQQVLEKVRAYWPQAELFHPRRDTVLIETHVSGITAEFAKETFKAMLAQHGNS